MKNLEEKVKEIIIDQDPLGIIENDKRNLDEYNPEVKDLVNRLHSTMSENEIRNFQRKLNAIEEVLRRK